MHTYMHTYTFTHTYHTHYTHTHTHTQHTHTYTNTPTHTHTHTQVKFSHGGHQFAAVNISNIVIYSNYTLEKLGIYICLCVCVCIYTYILLYVCTYMYIHIYTHTHTCMYIYIQRIFIHTNTDVPLIYTHTQACSFRTRPWSKASAGRQTTSGNTAYVRRNTAYVRRNTAYVRRNTAYVRRNTAYLLVDRRPQVRVIVGLFCSIVGLFRLHTRPLLTLVRTSASFQRASMAPCTSGACRHKFWKVQKKNLIR